MDDPALAVLAIVLGAGLMAGSWYLGGRQTQGQDARAPQMAQRARESGSRWERAMLSTRGRRYLHAFGFLLLGAIFVVLGIGALTDA
jgi:hypothetical protein